MLSLNSPPWPSFSSSSASLSAFCYSPLFLPGFQEAFLLWVSSRQKNVGNGTFFQFDLDLGHHIDLSSSWVPVFSFPLHPRHCSGGPRATPRRRGRATRFCFRSSVVAFLPFLSLLFQAVLLFQHPWQGAPLSITGPLPGLNFQYFMQSLF